MTFESSRPKLDWSKVKDSKEPQIGLWAPGEYLNYCRFCFSYFIGDKRAYSCYDCAVKGKHERLIPA